MERRVTTHAKPEVGVRRRSTGAVSPALAELGRRFARFREENARGSRVPGELRSAVLAESARGATPSEIARVCGVSWSQLRAWQGHEPREGDVANGDEVRVFSVVDSGSAAQSVAPSEQGLELRWGPWSVRVQLAERG
jgi:hypothetical protein